MFKNYLITAYRNIKRQRLHSFINISGLAIGMTCTILILLLVQDELSYDKYHENADRIYRVIKTQGRNSGEEYDVAITQAPLAASLKNNFPEIADAVCFNYGPGGLVKYGDKLFKESFVSYTDPSFFEMFSFAFLKGNPKTALNDPYSVVLTEDIAKKYFGDKEPLGEILSINNKVNLRVTGIIEKPKNSHIELSFIVPNTLYKEFGVDIESWVRSNYTTYVMLQKDANIENVNHNVADYFTYVFGPENTTTLFLQPLKRIYLHSNFQYEVHTRTSNINLVYILSLIAIFILLIACVNFMNLATARSEKRIKEVGLRKVVGANRRQLIQQFLGESILLSFFALLLAIILVKMILPNFNELIQRDLNLFSSPDLHIFLGLIGITLITGIIAGSYPAFFLSSFQPVKVLKGLTKKGSRSILLRRFLVIAQFSFSIILVIGTIVVYKQLYYMQNMKLGYDKEQLVSILMNEEVRKKYIIIKNELQLNPNILNVTASMNSPTWEWPSVTLSNWEGRNSDKEIKLYHGSVDYGYFETFKMEIIEGRSFSEQFSTDLTSALIVNEEAVRQMDMMNPIGKRLSAWDHSGSIIGVVKDFNFDNVRNKINPLVLKLAPEETQFIFIRIKPANIQNTLHSIENIVKRVAPEYPFEYSFLTDNLNNLYIIESVILKIVLYFTCLTIFIACLGLFGLVSFIAEERTKEIGIRKVLGASVSNIVLYLSKEFIVLVVLANIIAWPAAYFAMNKLLDNYAYHYNISIFVFLLSAVLAIIITLITVSYQALKAAYANPVDALRYE